MVTLPLELFPGHSVCVVLLEFPGAPDNFFQLFRELVGDAALIDADVVFHKAQLLTAVNVAFQRHLCGRRKTRSLHAEILSTLSAKHSVKEGLRCSAFLKGKQRCLVVAVNPGASFEVAVKHFAQEAGASVFGTENGDQELFEYLSLKSSKILIQNLYGSYSNIGWVCTKIAASEYVRHLQQNSSIQRPECCD
jgi:tRNA threonylcarbamoyladenosine modification (KEOPS) complex Cgi121 subunit